MLALPVGGVVTQDAVASLFQNAKNEGKISRWLVTSYHSPAIDVTAQLVQDLYTSYRHYKRLEDLDAEGTLLFYSNLAADIYSSHEFYGFLTVI